MIYKRNFIKIINFNHEGKGDFTADILDYTSKHYIKNYLLHKGIISYLNNVSLNFDSKLSINQSQHKYAFKNNKQHPT